MLYPKTDDQLRGQIITAGGMAEIHNLETRLNRHDINDRGEYRAWLERVASRYGVGRCEELPSSARAHTLPNGPAPRP